MKKHILAFATLCVAAITALGQTTTATSVSTTPTSITASIPTSLPIGTPEQLAAFAAGQTDHGYVSHSSTTMLVNNSTASFLQVQNTDIGDLMVGLAKANAGFEVANANDKIDTYVSIMNADWEPLYTGWRPNGVLTKSKTGKGWDLPTNQVELEISMYIPLKFAGAYFAELIVRDQNGNVSDYRRLGVNNDRIMFQTDLAGWGTELIVYWSNGGGYGATAYSVPNSGKMITPSTVTGTTSMFIENMLTFNDAGLNPSITNYGLNASVSYNANGNTNAPLMHVKLGQSRILSLGANAFAIDANKPFLKPVKYVIYQFANGEMVSVTEATADSNGFAAVAFAPGTYEITPIFQGDLFKKKALPQQQFIYGSTGGG